MNILPKVYHIEELPTLPEIIQNIRKFFSSKRNDNKVITHTILHDPSLAAMVLKVSNSARYRIYNSQRFSSVEEAVERIGIEEIEKIVSDPLLIKKFSNTQNLLNYHSFWRHSITAAYLAQVISEKSITNLSEGQQHCIFLSGLLHDLGILIYDQFFHQTFESIIQFSITEKKHFLDAEEIIAFTESHATIGSALLEIWNIDPSIISAIRFHHIPYRAPQKYEDITAVLFITEYILCNVQQGSFEGRIQDVNKSVWEYLGISLDNSYLLYKEATSRMRFSRVASSVI